MRDSASERLRAFVRERVKPGGSHYERGAAAKLARHLQVAGLGEDAAWISAYADPDAKPRRNADIDTALAICAFYGVDLHAFEEAGPRLSKTGSTVATSHKGGPADAHSAVERAHLREVAVLKARIARYEIAFSQMRDAAGALARALDVRIQGRAPARRRA